MQLRAFLVKAVQILYQGSNPSVLRLFRQLPFHLPGLVPFVKLPEILPHEKELFAGMGHHIRVGQPQICKFLLPLPGHLPQQCGLAVYHLVVGKHQNKFFAVGIDHAEGQLSVMIAPEVRVTADILQIIVHKAHIPLQIKAQAALIQSAGNHGEGRALLRNGKHTRVALFHNGIQVLYHFHGLQIFLSAIHICHPFSVIFSIIQIKHAGHGIHPDSVRMIFFHPEQRVGDQIVGHLRPSVVVDQRSPVGMISLSGILMLIQAGSVKIG